MSIQVLMSLLTATACALLSHFALALGSKFRIAALAGLALLSLGAPLIFWADGRVVRFFMGIHATLMVLKMWELSRLRAKGHALSWHEHWRFVANLLCLSIVAARRTSSGSLRQWSARLLVASVCMFVAMLMLGALQRWAAESLPFWLQHVVVATALMTIMIFNLDVAVIMTRLFGGRIIDANNRPWVAVTPADFWRRYNRIIGQFLHDNVFRPMRGGAYPVRALMAVFAVSGLLHEYVFWLAIERAVGLQLAFFLLQGAGVALTVRLKPRGVAVTFWRLGTWLFFLLSSTLFFVSFELMLPVYPDSPLAKQVIW